MMLTNLFLVVAAIAQDAKPKVEFDAPASFIAGEDYLVRISVEVPKGAAEVPFWVCSPAAITVNGQPLSKDRPAGIALTPGSSSSLTWNLSAIPAFTELVAGKEFKIGFAKEYLESEEKDVKLMQAADKGLDFMKIPAEELGNYHVILKTNRGDMELEFWPETAPNHVRNFLDLSYTGFYDGKTFHRIIPGFMIQGGDPTGTGTGNGPRSIKAEFSQRKHEPGVLSMARSQSPDSASCQFFIMHKAWPSLDGQYSCFGKLVSGLEVVDKIVNTPRGQNDKPKEPQTILKAIVVRAAGK